MGIFFGLHSTRTLNLIDNTLTNYKEEQKVAYSTTHILAMSLLPMFIITIPFIILFFKLSWSISFLYIFLMAIQILIINMMKHFCLYYDDNSFVVINLFKKYTSYKYSDIIGIRKTDAGFKLYTSNNKDLYFNYKDFNGSKDFLSFLKSNAKQNIHEIVRCPSSTYTLLFFTALFLVIISFLFLHNIIVISLIFAVSILFFITYARFKIIYDDEKIVFITNFNKPITLYYNEDNFHTMASISKGNKITLNFDNHKIKFLEFYPGAADFMEYLKYHMTK